MLLTRLSNALMHRPAPLQALLAALAAAMLMA
jgi:hypothetical protein